MNDEEKKQIITMFRNGASVSKVKKEFGHAWETLKKIKDEIENASTSTALISEISEEWSGKVDDYNRLQQQDKGAALDEKINLAAKRTYEYLIQKDALQSKESANTLKILVDIKSAYGNVFKKEQRLMELPYIIQRMENLMNKVQGIKDGSK